MKLTMLLRIVVVCGILCFCGIQSAATSSKYRAHTKLANYERAKAFEKYRNNFSTSTSKILDLSTFNKGLNGKKRAREAKFASDAQPEPIFAGTSLGFQWRREDVTTCKEKIDQASDPSKVDVTQHEFPPSTGGLVITWIGAPHPEVVVMNKDELDSSSTSNLYFSDDYGKSYTKISSVTEPIADVFSGASDLSGTYWVFALPERESSTGYWLSKDHGKTFSKIPVDFHFDTIIQHPTNPEKFLGLVLDVDESKSESETDESSIISHTVYVCEHSTSTSATCNFVEDFVFYVEWLNPKDETVDKVDTIILTTFEKRPQSILDGVDLIRYEAPFKQKKVLKKNCYMFEQQAEFFFVTEVPTQDGFDERILHVSTDEGNTFRQAKFPTTARHNHFHIVDASEGMVFATVQHTYTQVKGLTTLEVLEPQSAMINYTTSKAVFAPIQENGHTDTAELFFDKNHPDGCDGFSSDAMGKIILVDRGNCKFIEKVEHAENAGAIGVVVINSKDYTIFMTGVSSTYEPTIGAVMISNTNGQALKQLLDDTPGAVKVALIESDVKERALWKSSNLYASDETGSIFTLALKDVVYQPTYVDQNNEIYDETIDVYKVESQPGTYLANFINWARSGIYQTIITFNKGASWSYLPRPEGARCVGTEEDDCYLHLAMDSNNKIDGVPLPLSTSTASGFVMANGFVRRDVGYYGDEASVFVSRDGGYTWEMAEGLEGPHKYAILDHGGLLIAAPHFPGTSIWFSIDQGVTSWKEIGIVPEDASDSSNKDDDNDWIFDDDDGATPGSTIYTITEPGGSTLVAYAYYIDFTKLSFVGKTLDFAGLLERACDREISPDGDGDYEIWVPGLVTDVSEEPCLLGQRFYYRRRKPCRFCYNGYDHEAEYEKFATGETKTCSCKESDFKCIPGFYKSDPFQDASPCETDPEHVTEIPCDKGKDFATTVVYERVVGDLCVIDSNLDSIYTTAQVVQCDKSTKTSGGAVLGILVATITASVVLFAFVLYVSPSVRAKLIRTFGVEEGCLGSIGRCFAGCSWFRRQTTVQYSQLNQEETGGLLDDSDSDDDEALFGLDDAESLS